MLYPALIHHTLEVLNPTKELPTREEIEQKVCQALKDTIRLSKFKYRTVIEDGLSKLASIDGLEIYHSDNPNILSRGSGGRSA